MRLASLDIKLGFRMLVKYPGLTIVGGLAMAFAVWVGAVTFQLVGLVVNPTLPLPGGDRIVQIRNWDAVASEAEPRALSDYIAWKSSLKSVTDLGAWRDVTPNLHSPDGDVREVTGAEITAAAFRIAPTPPLMGRVISAADEQAGAAPVVVLGYDVWRTRFASDRAVLGRSVQLGDRYATVIGVMPKGFAFPVSHELWTPLKTSLLNHAPREGPGVTIFGRLAPGITLATAQAELALLGRRTAAEFPATHAHLLPRVTPYAQVFLQPTGTDRKIMLSINLFAVMLMVLISSNVALLMFARTATRENEMVVRSALGASRGRIITQLFAEALVLGGVAAAVGLAAAGFALDRWGLPYLQLNMGRLPFWYDVSLSPVTVLYTVGLTVLGAVIAGVVPALKVTRGLGFRLREGSAGGGGLRFGGVWTVVIITQVAATVAFPAIVFVQQRELVRIRSFDVGFAAREYLGARLEMDASDVVGADSSAARAADQRRFGAALESLRARVAAEPGVKGVTFIDHLPRMSHPEGRAEVVGTLAGGVLPEVSIASIDPSYFSVLETPILAGRAFHSGDVAAGSRVAIVDQGFVHDVLKGGNAIGRRVRFQPRDSIDADTPPPWYEIVGVVKELGMGYMTHHARTAGVYLPAELSSASSLYMMVHTQGDPMALAPRLRAISASVNPALRLPELTRVDQVTTGVQWILQLWIRSTVVLTAIAILLSLAGIYAVLSFTVVRRTREIGVRVALGASRGRVIAAIFRRPLMQVGLGVLAGGVLVGAGAVALSGGLSLVQLALLVAYAGVMLGVCLLACIVPTRRALGVEPTVALRGD